MIDLIFSLLLLSFIVVVLICLAYERKTHIAPVPTLPWVAQAIAGLLLKYKKPEDALQIAELGSGWGGLVAKLARHFPNASITGYELSPAPYWFARFRFAFAGRRIQVRCEDFYEADLSPYDTVVCYLTPAHLKRLKPKLERDLKAGALVLCNGFPVPEWEPLEVIWTRIFIKIPVYIYRR